MERNISFKRILQQLKADLIGKDSYRGVTLTYAWLANQFGHIALGFIPAFLLYHFFCFSAINSAIYVSLFWFLFELYNFLGPLLSKKKLKSKVNKYIFKPKWLNIAFDTFTDVCFFILGSLLFIICIDKLKNSWLIIIIIGLVIYLIFATRYWFITKMYQFYARYPFQFRLSQWNFTISTKDKEKVLKFLEAQDDKLGKHLLVFGEINAGKTSLGVGMLNELSIQNNRCLYLISVKLYDFFFKDEESLPADHEIWDWKMADYLMIDDVNPSEKGIRKLITAKDFLKLLNLSDEKRKLKNRTILKNKNIIWVLGKKDDSQKENEWVNMLKEIGIDQSSISVVSLQKVKG